MKRFLQLALVLAFVSGWGMKAHAGQFNINVPVDLSKMPSTVNAVIVEGFLFCLENSIGGLGSPGLPGLPGENSQVGAPAGSNGYIVVGVNKQTRSINTSTGEFHESIALSLNVGSGFSPNNVRFYGYRFKLRSQSGQESFPLISAPTGNENQDEFKSTNSLVFTGAGQFNNPSNEPNSFRRNCEG